MSRICLLPDLRWILRPGVLLLALLLLGHRPVAQAATFTVTTTADSGPGSLRQAILDANATPGPDNISFAIGPAGSQQTIQPSGALPIISDPVTIDGWSQGGAGYNGPPLIALNGALSGGNVASLNITAGSSTVRGLVINGFTGSTAAGIRLQTGGGNWIYGNYIGTDFTGAARIANQRGIWIDNGSSNNRIGTNADGVEDAAERNVISANIDQNIWIYQPATSGNRIMGNYIGLNAAGTAPVGTSNTTVATNGILVQEAAFTVIGTDGDGEGDALEGNLIGGNTYNVQLTGTSTNPSHHTRVSGNRIGTNASGSAGVGLQVEGVRVYVTEHNVVGTDGDGVSDHLEGNLISGHSDWGILVQQTAALDNVIAGNKIGTDSTGLSAIANGFGGSPRGGIYLGGYGNLVGSNFDGISDDLERNLISGNTHVAAVGILSQFVDQPGAVPNAIAGNWIGVDATGLAPLPNNYGISGASGASTGMVIRGNVISGHTYDGLSLLLTNAVVTGNYIGVGADGVTPLGNGNYGIRLSGNDNQIGGTGPGEANIIAHNGGPVATYSGIALSNATTYLRNTFRGNRIYANTRLGIDLALNGVTPNDDDDPDAGPNNLQNFPVITFAQAYADGTTVIQGTLNSNPDTSFILDFYYSAAADSSGYGEGEFYLGATTVNTDAAGDAAFDVTLAATIPPDQFVTATATHADGSTSEFSLAYAAGGVLDVPVSGLSLQAALPVYVDLPVQFSASVTGGTGVSYLWDFGDGGAGTGMVTDHTYATPGTYTVTVTAANNSSSQMSSTVINALEPANINGVRWVDRDGDGYFGMGEIINTVTQAEVTAALLQPPFTNLSAMIQGGSYQIFTPQAGYYQVQAFDAFLCNLITNCITSVNAVTVAIGSDGGTAINFGFAPLPFVPQAGDDGYIVGRAWHDSNGNGLPEATEAPLNGSTVRLLDLAGNQLASHVTGSSWSHGAYAFRISEPGSYRVQMDAPAGFFPPTRELAVYVADLYLIPVQFPFAAGGAISGQITNSSGAGLGGVTLTLQPGNLQTVTNGAGSYSYTGLAADAYTLQISPPANYIAADNITRFVPVVLNGSAVENWTLLKKGELTIKAVQMVSGQALPVSFLPFELILNGAQAAVVFTNVQGEATATGLAPGTYTVRPWGEIASLVPGLQLVPAERTAIVGNDSAAVLNFSGTLARSLNLFCQLPGTFGGGFACDYEVRTLNGSLIDTGYLPANQPATSNWNLNPATLEVSLIPDPDVPGQANWPVYSQIVVIADNTHVDVRYPWNPSNPQTIAGYAFWDRCAPQGVRANGNSCTESNVPANNGIPVTLYNQSGVEIASTLTAQGTSWNSGYFSFSDLPVGSYRVRVNLPPGYAPTTGVEHWYELAGVGVPELLEVGYQLNENQALGGRVFWDTDANGLFDEAWDDPIAGAAVAISRPDGTPVASLTTSANGGYSQTPINSGDYRITLTHAGQTWVRDASVPLSGGVPLIDFAVPPQDNRPRVLVFVDGNHNGVADAGEQRLADVSVRLRDAACGGSGATLQTVSSDSGGVAVFNPPPNGFAPVCAQVTAGLPADVLPADPAGVNVPRSGGAPVALALQPASTLLVRAFLDNNGNGSRESGEAYLSGASATINGTTKSLSSSGATFYLPGGSYPLQLAPPAGYTSAWTMPINIVMANSSAQTLLIPLRDAGSISGKIWPPNGGLATQNLAGSSLAAGLTVQLQNTTTNAIVAATSDAYGNFSFSNLAPATYRLRLPAPPPGYVANGEPLISYQTGQNLSGHNLTLVPTGHLVGVVFNDSNGNQQWDSNEPAIDDFTVRLVGAGGQEVALAVPDAGGYFRFESLVANTPYALQLANAPTAIFITTSPGVFTVGADVMTAQLGLGVAAPPASGNQWVGGTVQLQQGETVTPSAGARLIHYAPVNGACNVANPLVLYDQYTGANGGYSDQGAGGCFKVIDVPGYADSPGYYWGNCSLYSADCFLINGWYGKMVQVTLQPLAPQQAAPAGGGGSVNWSAFRDDNGNGFRDAGEPGLAGVTLSGGGAAGISGQTGWGQPLSLGAGLHELTITPPAGYLVHGPAQRSLSIQGKDVTLPPLPLRPAGLTLIQTFVDLDGDGVQDVGEAGVGGISVTLTGITVASATTTPNGQISFAGLPDGNYQVAGLAPAGFIAMFPSSANLTQGGVIQIPVQLPGLISAIVYGDWDGDGQQQPDEPIYRLPITATLSSGAGTQLQAGAGGTALFLGLSPGDYTVAASLPAVAPATVSLAAGQGAGLSLPLVGPGEVRGIAWLDANGDGQRQSWETPLAGIAVTLDGVTMVTDRDGRYQFNGIAPGSYQLAVDLPPGLTADLSPIVVGSGRGAVVGIPASAQFGYAIFLPVILMRP